MRTKLLLSRNKMYSCFIVLVLIPGIFGNCRSPIKNIAEPCSIRNLTIVDNDGRVLASNNFCNGNVQSLRLKKPPRVNFSTSITLHEIKNRRYLFAVIDSTSNQLLWMVANITISGVTRRLLPVSNNSRSIILKPYQEPAFNSSQPSHQINFFVFEANITDSVQLTKHEIQSFNLTKWLETQFNEKNVPCGPVAGAQLTVFASHQTSSAPGNGQGSSFSGSPYQTHQPQNNFSTWHSHPADRSGHAVGTWSSYNGSAYNSNDVLHHRPAVGNTNFPSSSSPPYRGKSQKRNVGSIFHPSYSITYFATAVVTCIRPVFFVFFFQS